MGETKTQTARLILALSVLLLVAGKAPPETTPELPTIWERKIPVSEWGPWGCSCLPAVGEDRSVYVGSWDGTLYAFSGGGSQSWKYDTKRFETKRPISEGVGGIAIDSSGTIYATSDGLLAFDKDGVLKWRIWSEKNRHASAPALGPNDRIHVLFGENLFAFASDGTVEWVSEIHAPLWARSAPIVGRDGMVYVAGLKGESEKSTGLLYAFRSDGSLKWTFETDSEHFHDPPALDEESTVYFLGARGLYAVDKKGKLKWFYDTQGLSGSSTPAVSSDHVIYFGRDNFLFAVGPDGKLKWRFETDNEVRSSPAIDEKGNIWFVSNDEHLYCVDRQGTLVGAWPFEGLKYATVLIGTHGQIYLSGLRSLRVLRGTNGPADCPWPMKRHDVQGTARFSFH
jgi:outer membrane protein assembly factor BamB